MKIALIGTTAFAITLVAGLGGTTPAKAGTIVQDFAPFFTVTVTVNSTSDSLRILADGPEAFDWSFPPLIEGARDPFHRRTRQPFGRKASLATD